MEQNWEEQYQRVCAYVDLDAIHENMEHMKNNIRKETKIMGVIKTDGYGHGAVPIARELEPEDYIYGFATATVEEALILRKAGIKKPLLILGYTFPYCYENLIKEEIRPAVFREDMLEGLAQKVRMLRREGILQRNEKCRVHVKVDTGMSRVGILPNDAGMAFIQKVLSYEELLLEGIFTHFARADEADKTAAHIQLQVFTGFLQRIEQETGYSIPVKHCSNSAGIVELPEANMDVVRAGITLYGMWPSGEVKRDIVALKPALKLVSHIVYIKNIAPGTAVGYGGTFVADKPMTVATIPVGYGDGYPRGLSGKGYVLVHGKKAAILGRICMDQFMIDITELEQVAEGDEVVLIGDGITMEELGELSGRFNYELACDLGKRVPRVYWKNKKAVSAKDYTKDYE